MNKPDQQSRKFYVLRGGQESGPFTIRQLNRMHGRREISGSDLCRAADSADYKPLATVFPHMADAVRKSPLEREIVIPPYRRWFYWLLFGCIYTLAVPYCSNPNKSQVYSSEIRTFIKTDQGLQPTTEPIWIDGRTAAIIDASFWLYFSLAIVAFEATIWGILRWRVSRRTRVAPIASHASTV